MLSKAEQLKEQEDPCCPVHNTKMLMMYGCGWDYDRWLCVEKQCYEEIELETTTYPEGME